MSVGYTIIPNNEPLPEKQRNRAERRKSLQGACSTAKISDTVLPPPIVPVSIPTQNSDRFLGVASVSVATVYFLFQVNGGAMNWWLSLIVYTACIYCCVWSFLKHFAPHKSFAKRFVGAMLVVILLGGLAANGIVSQYKRDNPTTSSTTPTPSGILNNRAFIVDGDYKEGTSLGGIPWNSKLTDLRVWITNPTNQDLDTLDLIVRPEGFVFRAALLNPTLGCELLDVSDSEVHDSVVDQKTGKKMSNTWSQLSSNVGSRLRCSRFPANFSLKTVFAAVSTASRPDGLGMPYAMFGPRPHPRRVTVAGTFNIGSKSYVVKQDLVVGKGN